MRILVPTASFQYDVANCFARDLAQGLAGLPGQEVATGHLSGPVDLERLLCDFRPDLVLSIQGVGIDHPVVAKHPGAAWMVMGIDHPSHIYGRMHKIQTKRALITAFEEAHMPCLKILAPEIPRAFLAHPAPASVVSARRPELGLCFLGTWKSPAEARAAWMGTFEAAALSRLEAGLSTAMSRRCADAAELLDSDDPVWQGSRGRWSVGVAQLDLMIRLVLRIRLLKELDEAGLAVNLYGAGWDAADWRHHRVHPALDYNQALLIGARALGVLSITPTLPAGSHERPLSCLGQGSVCLTTPSRFYQEAGFVAGRDYLDYDPWEPGALGAAVAKLADFHSSACRREALPESRARILREHSPLARARQILRLAEQHFGLV
ncbi:MAG: hypothetical protein RL095_1236 [Verrucomicrobiota bacterium]|jgi:hypothetical protein